MNEGKLAQLEALVRQYNLARHWDYIRGITIPRINIQAKPGAMQLGKSRFGGLPDVPAGFRWPQRNVGEYKFLGQIALRDLPLFDIELPRSGLLSLFYAYHDDGDVEGLGDKFVLAKVFSEGIALSPMTPPSGLPQQVSLGLTFEASVDVPHSQEQVQYWPFDRAEADYFGLIKDKLNPGDAQLFGYPYMCTLGDDPTPGPDWVPFLSVYSINKLGWCWHDGDWLRIFIRRQDLAAGDFSTLETVAG